MEDLMPSRMASNHDHFHDKMRQLREQFYAGRAGSGPERKIKRSFTEHIRRDSVDSGLSSPSYSSQISNSASAIVDHRPAHRLTRHLSLDNNAPYNDSEKVYALKEEAESTHKLVDDIVSTKTMRRRRTESSKLSIPDRKRQATESVSSSVAVAPSDSEWGPMFDEMIAKLKGIERSADEAHICNRSTCASGCMLDDSVIDSDSDTKLSTSSVFDTASNKNSSNSIDSALEEEISHKKMTKRLFRSNTDTTRGKNVTFDMKSLMRSISFQRPDLATYNQPLNSLRRTDSDNDVWIERPMNVGQRADKPKVAKPDKSQVTLKRSSTWTKLSKIFINSKTKS